MVNVTHPTRNIPQTQLPVIDVKADTKKIDIDRANKKQLNSENTSDRAPSYDERWQGLPKEDAVFGILSARLAARRNKDGNDFDGAFDTDQKPFVNAADTVIRNRLNITGRGAASPETTKNSLLEFSSDLRAALGGRLIDKQQRYNTVFKSIKRNIPEESPIYPQQPVSLDTPPFTLITRKKLFSKKRSRKNLPKMKW